mmetsp:Transcript_8106/g.19394  ORF Transcript_8106/g.19394 Transcript_8106/m.19394 type:complete len:211 (-) Transcript_8106:1767-2399(-)
MDSMSAAANQLDPECCRSWTIRHADAASAQASAVRALQASLQCPLEQEDTGSPVSPCRPAYVRAPATRDCRSAHSGGCRRLRLQVKHQSHVPQHIVAKRFRPPAQAFASCRAHDGAALAYILGSRKVRDRALFCERPCFRFRCLQTQNTTSRNRDSVHDGKSTCATGSIKTHPRVAGAGRFRTTSTDKCAQAMQRRYQPGSTASSWRILV